MPNMGVVNTLLQRYINPRSIAVEPTDVINRETHYLERLA